MDIAELKANLQNFLGRLSRRDYLAIYSASILSDLEPEEVAKGLAVRLGNLEEIDEQGRTVENVKILPEQIRKLASELPDFVIDILLVDLEAFIHTFLADAAGQCKEEDSAPFENLIAKLWPAKERQAAQQKKSGQGVVGRHEHWSYKDLILLSEIRNAIVHGDGKVSLARTKNRLVAAKWTEKELEELTVHAKRNIGDLFRFKRAVRTLANAVILSLELEMRIRERLTDKFRSDSDFDNFCNIHFKIVFEKVMDRAAKTDLLLNKFELLEIMQKIDK